MNYTVDWFSENIPKFSYFSSYLSSFPCKVLEIGSFEGRSSNWFVENYCKQLGSQLTCIDTFQGSWEHEENQTQDLFEKFKNNVSKNIEKIRIFQKGSEVVLPQLLEDKETFDFIYIDGNHTFDAVMCDAIYSHKLINPKGIIVFDDYGWEVNERPDKIPHHAINAFLTIHKHEYEILEMNYQVTMRKL
jgi:predicted O-methyltransferase YrrM